MNQNYTNNEINADYKKIRKIGLNKMENAGSWETWQAVRVGRAVLMVVITLHQSSAELII